MSSEQITVTVIDQEANDQSEDFQIANIMNDHQSETENSAAILKQKSSTSTF